MKALCIGHASYDFTMPMNSYPIENSKYRVTDAVGCGGGPASNAAYLLAKWGIDTYFAGVVGKDDNGRKIKDEFVKIGVNTKYLEMVPNNDTTISFIIVNNKTGTRTVFTKKDKDIKLSKTIDLKADLILVDGQELEASKKAIKNNPKAISMIDAGRMNSDVVELAKMVDYVACSRVFAEDYTKMRINLHDSASLKEIFKIMTKDFKNVVITLEDKGALYQKDNKIKLMPSIKVKQVDSTGAGDIFHGAFAYSLLNNFDIEKTIMLSNITGAISVTRLGGRYSMPTLKEVKDMYKKCTKE